MAEDGVGENLHCRLMRQLRRVEELDAPLATTSQSESFSLYIFAWVAYHFEHNAYESTCFSFGRCPDRRDFLIRLYAVP